MYAAQLAFLIFAVRGFSGKGHFIDLSDEYKLTYVSRWVCGEKKGFWWTQCTVHSLMIHWLLWKPHCLIKGLAKKSHESHYSSIALSTAVLVQWLFPYKWRSPSIRDTFFAWLANIFFPISELVAMKQIKSWRSLPAKLTGKVNTILFVT